MTSRLSFTVLVCSSLTLIACEGSYNAGERLQEAQYWQKINSSEAVYTQGPKAQQMLNRDLARCAAEIRELAKLGALRDGVQSDFSRRVKDPDEREMTKWDEPSHDGYLRAEYGDYHDFEGCMASNGWERVLYAPYDVATEGQKNYRRALVDYEYRSRHKDNERQDPNFVELNE